MKHETRSLMCVCDSKLDVRLRIQHISSSENINLTFMPTISYYLYYVAMLIIYPVVKSLREIVIFRRIAKISLPSSVNMKKPFSIDDYDIKVFKEHPKVTEVALKHCRTWNIYSNLTVLSTHTVFAFEEAQQFVDSFYGNQPNVSIKKYVIIDSGCGVGHSSIRLSKMHPTTPVIGIDRSFVRLSKNKYVGKEMTASERPPNLLLLRAELSDFWLQICIKSDWTVLAHYILYPNPYPKSKHLQLRWQGTDVLVVIIIIDSHDDNCSIPLMKDMRCFLRLSPWEVD